MTKKIKEIKISRRQTELEMLSNSLAGGAEGSGDDGFRVSLQGAGAAGHGPDPEHSLRLVDHWENLLRLHPKSLNTRAQAGHHLSLAADEEGQRNRLLLQRNTTPIHRSNIWIALVETSIHEQNIQIREPF